MKWVTRERRKIDRIASPLADRPFIDEEPEFLYVPSDQVLAVAEDRRRSTARRVRDSPKGQVWLYVWAVL